MLEPSGSKQVELMLDYFPNADHAGIYAAQAAGHFEQAGLDVEIRTPPDPSAPIKQVAAGNVDLAISYEPEVFRARDIGLNVVSIGAIVRSRSPRSSRCRRRRSARPGTWKERRSARRGSTTRPPTSRRSSPRRAEHGLGEGAQRRLQPHPGAAHRQGRRHAGRLLELRGHRPAPARQAAADHPHGGRRRPDLQRARAGGERGRARARQRQAARLHRRALARDPRPAREPRRGDRGPARGESGPRSRAAARGCRR